MVLLLAGCGGGSGTSASCSLGSAVGCGGGPAPGDTKNPPPTTPPESAVVGSVDLVVSNGSLASSGLAGTEVKVTALVKTADNVAVANVPVQFSADSGFLSVGNGTSDAGGKASATLGTGGSKANRAITITAKAAGKLASVVVQVTGTHLAVNAPAYVLAGDSATLTATLLDSANQPIAGQAVVATAKNGNSVSVNGPSDSNGQVTVRLAASNRGDEEITLRALGTTITRPITVGGNELSLSPEVTMDAGGNQVLRQITIGSCTPIDGSTTSGAASVTLNASRGMLYRDADCTVAAGGALALSGGNFPRTYLKSDVAAVVTIEAALSNGLRGSTSVEFVAPLGPTSWVSVQPDQAIVGSGERSTLIAVVRDGTAANNLVKGATVEFTIVSDPSGGNLLSPLSAVTGSDGVARAVFVAGSGDGAGNGTVIQARIAGMPYATTMATLTVNKRALSIQFGTGTKLLEFSSAVLQQDFAVFVSDNAGNPVKDVAINAAAWPTRYAKGSMSWQPQGPTLEPGMWVPTMVAICPNEDVQRKGVYDRALDANGNGTLEPGIPLVVTASGKTDAMGLATVTLRYPRDRAYWVEVELTVTGVVAGTESVARSTLWLGGVANDYGKYAISPPGAYSPYGSGACTSPD